MDSGAKHMLCRKDLSSAELETNENIQKVQTNEVATAYVKDLDLFVTKTHGYTYEWIGGQKSQHIEKGMTDTMQH